MSSPSEANEPASYRGYRYPIEVISHAVWLYFRVRLSLCDVEATTSESDATARLQPHDVGCWWSGTPPGERWLASARRETERSVIPTTDLPAYQQHLQSLS